MKTGRKNLSKFSKFTLSREKASKTVGGDQEGGPRTVIIQAHSEQTEGGPRTVII